ncbi:MAG: hypothetical protein A2Z29_04555 [Chloroflexi bacterium RBG_16_56_11]|nr:MAG: hypothetical protein A2Z29_04555 [Chloroflexi bacterium RBG_16_56_11]
MALPIYRKEKGGADSGFVKQIDVIGNEVTLHYSIPMVPEKIYLDEGTKELSEIEGEVRT